MYLDVDDARQIMYFIMPFFLLQHLGITSEAAVSVFDKDLIIVIGNTYNLKSIFIKFCCLFNQRVKLGLKNVSHSQAII